LTPPNDGKPESVPAEYKNMSEKQIQTDAELLKAPGAAGFLTVSRRTFERMKDQGLIPHVRFGRVLRYRKSDLLKVIDRLTVR
jgi:excisionase family DNA binding protein